jgi:arabinofuranosyltransferase
MLVCAWVLFAYGRRVGNPLGFAIGLLIGFSLPYFYLTYGMETGLFLAMISICLYLYVRGNYGLLAVAGALLILTRIEGGLLLVCLLAEHLIQRRKLPSWRILIAPALILAAHYTFNRVYYGTWVPDTGSAKIWQGESGLWGSGHLIFFNVGYLRSWVFFNQTWLWLLIGALALAGLVLEFRRTRPFILFAILYTAFYGILNIPDYHWYYAPLFLTLFAYAGLGVFHVGRLTALAAREQRSRPLVQTVAALTVLAAMMAYVWPKTAAPEDARFPTYRQAGLWINQHLPANASVSAVEIGTIGYYANRPFIDILGLVNPDNARFLGERKFDAWLTVYHPDYFLMHSPMYPHEISVKHLLDQGKLWIRPDFHVKGLVLYCQPGESGCVPITS